MNHSFVQQLVRWTVLALGVTIATKIIPGIRCDDLFTLIVVVVLLSFFNAILKPLIVLFTLPFIVLTMGLGLLVINAFLFLLVGKLVDGFYVGGFWPALGGALVVSLTNYLTTRYLLGKGGRGPRPPPSGGAGTGGTPGGRKPPGDDVIDI